MRHNHKHAGFTLIELMLAMVFVSFILVFIALTLVQMLRTYDKGVAMKQVNQAGRSIVDDISRAVRSQLPSSIQTQNVDAGVLCVDNTMYIWNPLFTGTSLGTANLVTGPGAHNAVTGNATTGGTMARKTLSNPALGCARTSATVAGQDSVLLSNRARVLWADVTVQDSRLVTLHFVFGTYDRSEAVTNSFTNFNTTAYLDGVSPNKSITCRPGTSGNYCAFTEFTTTVYLSKEQQ